MENWLALFGGVILYLSGLLDRCAGGNGYFAMFLGLLWVWKAKMDAEKVREEK